MTKTRTILRHAAEAMAFRARECGTTVMALFANQYEVSFSTGSAYGTDTVERMVDLTPELMAQAEAIREEWASK